MSIAMLQNVFDSIFDSIFLSENAISRPNRVILVPEKERVKTPKTIGNKGKALKLNSFKAFSFGRG